MLYRLPLKEVVVGDMVVCIVVGVTGVVVVMVGSNVVAVIGTGVSPMVVVVIGGSIVLLVIETGVTTVVVVSEPQRSAGITAGVQEAEVGSQVDFLIVDEESQE